MQHTAETLPTSTHFQLEQLADGVFAAIGSAGGAAYSNAGIIDLGGHTLIFDTFNTPQAAEDLRAAAEHLTGRPVTYAIISHAHADHWRGNQVFDPRTAIIATRNTRETMPEAIGLLEGLKENPTEVEQEIQEVLERLKTETEPRWRSSLEKSITRMQHLLEALPTLDFRLPHLTFDGRLVFHGTERTAELRTLAKGHTSSDAFLVLPAERVMFMGDLGFFQCQPFMGLCDPQAWTAQLENMERSEIETFVPGHGPLGTKADLKLQRQYITLLEELVAQVLKGGGSVEEAVEKVQGALPSPFDAWLMGGMTRYEANVQSSYKRLAEAET